MTISVAPARNEYTGNAGQTIFNFTFKIFSTTDLNVYITPSGQGADDSTDITVAYTVTGLNDEDGGFITLNSGVSLNDLVTIVSNVPSSRTVDYQNNGDFRPDTVNTDFDTVVSIVKKIEDDTNRSLLLPQSQQGPKPLTLPNPLSQAIMRWKSDLSGLENVFISELSPGVFPNDEFTLQGALAGKKVDTTVSANQVYIFSDRNDALFDVITGTGTANGSRIVAHDILNLSFVLRDSLVDSAWGVVGDNVADDSAALIALINFADGEEITLTKDVYKADLNGLTTTKLNIRSTAPLGYSTIHNTTITTFENFTFFNLERVGFDSTLVPDGISVGVFLKDSSNINIDGKNVTIWRNAPRSLLTLNGCTDFDIHHTKWEDAGREQFVTGGGVNQGDSINIVNSNSGEVHHNRSFRPFQIHIFVFTDSVGECFDVDVYNNYGEDALDNGIRCQPGDLPDLTSVHDIRFWNNHVKGSAIDNFRFNGENISSNHDKSENATGWGAKTDGGLNITINNFSSDGDNIGIGARVNTRDLTNYTLNSPKVLNTTGSAAINIVSVNAAEDMTNITVTNPEVANSTGAGLVVAGTTTNHVDGVSLNGGAFNEIGTNFVSLAFVNDLTMIGLSGQKPNNVSSGAAYLIQAVDGGIITACSADPDGGVLTSYILEVNDVAADIADNLTIKDNDFRGANNAVGVRTLGTGVNIQIAPNWADVFSGPTEYTSAGVPGTKAITAGMTVDQLAGITVALLADLEAGRFIKFN